MSWKPEIRAVGENSFCQNSLVFETEEEALSSAKDLHGRWMMAKEYRAVEVDKPVNYRWDNEFGNIPLDRYDFLMEEK